MGSHGLVTASMQDLANKSQDSGRCPVCGKVYQWKLLNHVAKDHGKVLKPAHLSYKCTVSHHHSNSLFILTYKLKA